MAEMFGRILAPPLPASWVALRSKIFGSLGLNRSAVAVTEDIELTGVFVAASWSDLQRARAPVKLVVLELTTAAANEMASSEICR